MINNLKKSLKNDIWERIDGNKPQERSKDEFIKLVFYLMLENNSFLMDDVFNISNEIKDLYEEVLENSEQRLIDANGNMLNILKEINDDFDNKIKVIIRRIKRLKKNDR